MSENEGDRSRRLRILNSSTVLDIRSAQLIPSFESLVASLLHNSITGGAKNVILRIQPSSLRVTAIDDGPGCTRSEWAAMFSKSTTLAGRGKTLNSIAAVACVELSSSCGGIHVRKTVRAGVVLEDSPATTPPAELLGNRGVIVDVWELFHNLPVRRRAALDITQTQLLENVRRRVVAVALSNTHVHIKLEMKPNKSLVFESPQSTSLSLCHIEAAFGTSRNVRWVPVKAREGACSVDGFFASDSLSRSAGAQMVSINGIPLDRKARVYKLLRAISRDVGTLGSTAAPRMRFQPAFVVNVHCSRGAAQVSAIEHGALVVGFRSLDVENFVASSVKKVVKVRNASSRVESRQKERRAANGICNREKQLQSMLSLRAKKRIWRDIDNHDFGEAKLDLKRARKNPHPASTMVTSGSRPLSASERRRVHIQRPRSSSAVCVRRPESAAAVMAGLSKSLPSWQNPCFASCGRAPRAIAPVCTRGRAPVLLDMNRVRVTRLAVTTLRVIGQVDTKFIMVADAEGTLYAVDQHAASERALFEALLREVGSGAVLTGAVRPPLNVRLSESQQAVLERHWSAVHRWGWRLRWGTGVVAVLGVPCIGPSGIAVDRPEQLLTVVDDLADGASPVALPSPFRIAAASVACHAAVRFGDTLSLKQCAHVVEALAACDDPFACAHGRPSIVPLALFPQVRTVEKMT